MIYILLLSILAIILFLPKNWEGLIPYLRQMFGKQIIYPEDMKTKERLINKALLSLSCDPVWGDDGVSRLVKYDYQNGHFCMRIEPHKSFVRLSYLFFFNTSMEHLSLVRSLCNQVNMNSEIERIIYSLNEEQNEIDLHIITGVKPTEEDTAEMLRRVMANIFGWQNAFVRRFDEVMNETKEQDGEDKELDDAEWQRELFLLRQQELTHQEPNEIRTSVMTPLALETLVRKVMGLEGFVPSEMTVTGVGTTTVTGRDEVASYNLAKPLIQGQAFVCQEAMVRLTYFDLRQPDVRRQMAIHLKSEKSDGQALYFRVTMTIVPLSVSRKVHFESDLNRTEANSVLVAYDLTSPKQRTDEFLYMWKEAQEKQKKGETDGLTAEQQMISECVDRETAKNLYHGRQLYLCERYYEALLYLEDAFNDLAPYFDYMGKTVLEKFHDLCYYIGFCYTELKQYQKAFYYLDIISGLRRITYTTELVNCMVNSGDVRTIPFINSLITQMQLVQDMDDEEEDESQDHIDKFINFLKRRKAYVLVERRQYAEAKTLLNELLDDLESHDFAIYELSFIEKNEQNPQGDHQIDLPG